MNKKQRTELARKGGQTRTREELSTMGRKGARALHKKYRMQFVPVEEYRMQFVPVEE